MNRNQISDIASSEGERLMNMSFESGTCRFAEIPAPSETAGAQDLLGVQRISPSAA